MNMFEKVLFALNNLEMPKPTFFGWYHVLWIGIVIICIFVILKKIESYTEKNLSITLLIYGFGSLILEIIKQIMWSFHYSDGVITWSYLWYAAPFQLCSMPMYIAIITAFLRKGKLKDSLLSYLALFGMLSAMSVIIYPLDCFTNNILINIHTMYLHCLAFVIAMYIIINRSIKLDIESLTSAIKVFVVLVGIAFLLNVAVYNLILPSTETFNMFYISPYFISSLPVFNIIQENVPYLVFLTIYIVSLSIGASIVYLVSNFIQNKVKIKNSVDIRDKNVA